MGVDTVQSPLRSPVLVLDGSRDPASVAVVIDGAVAASRQVLSRDPHTGLRSERLIPAVAEALAEAGVEAQRLAGVCCSRGPGGFTSLRGTAAFAKGICSSLGIPLYTVPVFELIAADRASADGTYLVMLDAGRGEYHAAIVPVSNHGQDIGPADPLPLGTREQVLETAAGRGVEREAEREAQVIDGDAYDLASDPPRAAAIGKLLERVLSGGPVDMDSWEPLYGRLPEAQVVWERRHGTQLDVSPPVVPSTVSSAPGV